MKKISDKFASLFSFLCLISFSLYAQGASTDTLSKIPFENTNEVPPQNSNTSPTRTTSTLKLDEELDNMLSSIRAAGKYPDLYLHYQPGPWQKFTHFFFSRAQQDTEHTEYGKKDSSHYAGMDPFLFSKTSANLYHSPIGYWGGNLAKAIQDNEQSKAIMQNYRQNAIASSLLFYATIGALTATILGSATDTPFFGSGQASHLIIGLSSSGVLLTGSVWFDVRKKGKIQRATAIYNR
jgi:hypothetical protein